MTETSFGCVLVGAFLLLPRRRFLAGLALGYAYLIRPEALLVVLGVKVWPGWRDRRIPWRLAAGAAVSIIPYVLFIHHHTGEWALTGKMGFLEGALQRNEGGAFFTLLGGNLKTFLPMLPGQLGVPVVLLVLVGIWLKPQVGENTKVAAYKPYASFWAGCEFVKYAPDMEIRDLLDHLEKQEVEYLIVNAHIAKVFVPCLQALLGRQVAPELKNRVEPLKIFDYPYPDQFTVVFRLK